MENGKEMNPKMPIASTLPQIYIIFRGMEVGWMEELIWERKEKARKGC